MNEYSVVQAVRAVLKVTVEHKTQELILAALGPELSHQNPSRSSISIKESAEGFSVRVKARDLSSFRASFTSILRLLNVIVEIQRIIQNEAC